MSYKLKKGMRIFTLIDNKDKELVQIVAPTSSMSKRCTDKEAEKLTESLRNRKSRHYKIFLN